VIRVVLDANVLASALINRSGVPGEILRRIFQDPEIVVVVSPEIVAEIRRILEYPRIATRAGLTKAVIEDFVERFLGVAAMVPDRRSKGISADPDDDKYLLAAREGVADFVVSGDHHLLDLQFYERVRIVSPKRFLEVLGP
jgi:putative PIN family toxin of toxin-antitoxin system